MARRKTIIRVKLPFLKFKVNKKTTSSIIGIIIVAFSLILLVSFLNFFSGSNNARFLSLVNRFLIEKFSGLAIFIPFITLLFSGHFLNSKKIKFVKPNVTIGVVLFFISLLGVLQAGQWGKAVFENLAYDFSLFGALVILFVSFIMGLILFFDTSIDAFVLFLIKLIKPLVVFSKQYLFRQLASVKGKFKDKDKIKRALKKDDFITDKRIEKTVPSLETKHKVAQGLTIKPLVKASSSVWTYPPVSLLEDIKQVEADRGDVKKNADVIEKTLESFGIRTRISEVNYGPTVTQYALEITMGTKLSKITALGNDLALALAAPTGQVRIEAPIPGRSLVGIEIPNQKPQLVTLKKILSSPAFKNNKDPLLVPLGLDVSGEIQASSISKMPHVLIAGTTGSGKSVLLNAWISTFLLRTRPEDLRLILIDPKRVELTLYNGIPHLLTEVIVESDKIISALRWVVKEMETRYKEFAKAGVRNLDSYNQLENFEKKPYIVFVIDELADLMIFAASEAEDLITRIAQMARATGIHLILATQRPSVDVITGLMKANIPTRVAFNVSSMVDSRVILDMPGAEKLLGKGDMLFLPPDISKPRRIQGPFVNEKEVNQIVKFLKMQSPEIQYTEEITDQEVVIKGRQGGTTVDGQPRDDLFNKAIEIIIQHDKASASLLQRRLSIGYARAARILDQLEIEGYVSPAEGSKPRDVIKRPMVGGSDESENPI